MINLSIINTSENLYLMCTTVQRLGKLEMNSTLEVDECSLMHGWLSAARTCLAGVLGQVLVVVSFGHSEMRGVVVARLGGRRGPGFKGHSLQANSIDTKSTQKWDTCEVLWLLFDLAEK